MLPVALSSTIALQQGPKRETSVVHCVKLMSGRWDTQLNTNFEPQRGSDIPRSLWSLYFQRLQLEQADRKVCCSFEPRCLVDGLCLLYGIAVRTLCYGKWIFPKILF